MSEGPGRPKIPAADRKSEMLWFRATKKEKRSLESAAKTKGLTLTAWLRILVGLGDGEESDA